MAVSLAEPTRSIAPTAAARDGGVVPCAHCALPVPAGLVGEDPDRSFCCGGCRAAFALLHAHGLEGYYAFGDRRDEPVRATGRSYEEFDHVTFHAIYALDRPDGLREIELQLEGVHCASCVWLVERVPLAVSGVVSAELDVGRSRARIVWDPDRARLSRVAQFLDSLGYPAHPFRGARADRARRDEARAALVRIGVAGAIAGNVMLIALAIYAGWFGGIERSFERYFRWWSLLLTTPAIFWPGRVFFRSALGALRARALHMDVPIALALAAGYLRGAVNVVRDEGPIYFDGVATLVFLLLVGRYLQQRAQSRATDAAELLASLTPSTARVVEHDAAREVPAEAVLPGDTLEVRVGDTLAADGIVTSGTSAIDAALLTGEARPVIVAANDPVFAGTVNAGGPLRVRVTHAGESSRLGRLLAQVEASSRRRAPVVRLADRVAAWFVAAVLVLAALTYAVWTARDASRALDYAIAMLVVTCPCALALATPLAITVAIARAARRGILVKGGDALEQLARSGTLLLDKTGTVTRGRLELARWEGPDDARALVLALERQSRHPVAAAFARAWPDVKVPDATEVRETIGCGIEGRVGDRRVLVGTPAFLLARRVLVPAPFAETDATLAPVLVAVDGLLVARAAFADPLREDAADAVHALRRLGWRIRLLSGDNPAVVTTVARALGIPETDARGGVTPEEKREAVLRHEREEQRGAGKPVVMAGDGVNDAAAIAAATVGVGVRGGAEACLAAADVFLAREGLGPLVELVAGARRTLRVIRTGVLFSIAWNVVGATLAMMGRIDPLVAAVLMPLSSLTVVLIASQARTFRGGVT